MHTNCRLTNGVHFVVAIHFSFCLCQIDEAFKDFSFKKVMKIGGFIFARLKHNPEVIIRTTECN